MPRSPARSRNLQTKPPAAGSATEMSFVDLEGMEKCEAPGVELATFRNATAPSGRVEERRPTCLGREFTIRSHYR